MNYPWWLREILRSVDRISVQSAVSPMSSGAEPTTVNKRNINTWHFFNKILLIEQSLTLFHCYFGPSFITDFQVFFFSSFRKLTICASLVRWQDRVRKLLRQSSWYSNCLGFLVGLNTSSDSGPKREGLFIVVWKWWSSDKYIKYQQKRKVYNCQQRFWPMRKNVCFQCIFGH
jgi:hypothetical protein